MKIIVCIKQVPGSSNVKIDPENGTLIRDSALSKMNPYDLFALEIGLKLKQERSGELVVVSMGPDSAKEVIKEAIYMGADKGILLSDRKFAGADVLATSYTLASGIKTYGDFDLIITGKQTTDGDTAQVGSELAEHLNIPNVCYVHELKSNDDYLEYTSSLDNKIIKGKISLPCLVCVDGDINTPRLPSFKRKQEFKDCEDLIKTITFNDLKDQDENHYGLKGSPTQVEKIFEPENNIEKTIIDTGDLATQLFDILKDKKFI